MANRFWVGGTGTWDSSTTTNWAATSGGAGGQTVPGSGDDVTFDSASGGGTVTVNFGGLITIQSLTTTTFTGTLDFATNNNSLTMSGSFGGSGAATRTVNLGSGTFTITGATSNWDSSGAGLTLNAGTSTIAFTATTGSGAHRFFGGSKTYNNITIAGNADNGLFFSGGGCTITSLTINAPNTITFTAAQTYTITTLASITGAASTPVLFSTEGVINGRAIITLANSVSVSWCAFNQIQVGGTGTITATNSLDFANNTGNLSITPPSGSGGVIGVIGG